MYLWGKNLQRCLLPLRIEFALPFVTIVVQITFWIGRYRIFKYEDLPFSPLLSRDSTALNSSALWVFEFDRNSLSALV